MKSRKSAPFRLTAVEPTEFDLQKSVADLLDWILLPPAFYTAFPAGWGKLPPRIAGLLKACGLKRGMPDVLVFDKYQMMDNLFCPPKIVGIELKRPSRKTATSDDQDVMHDKLRTVGIPVHICWKVEQVIEVLDRHSIHRRAHFLDGDKHAAQTAGDQAAEEGIAAQSAQGAR